MDLKELEILKDSASSHWYYQAKLAMLLQEIRGLPIQKILDIGAGSGLFSEHLLMNTDARSALCIDINYCDDREALAAEKIIQFRQNFDFSDADLVLVMDVLEHVDNDIELLAQLKGKVKFGAFFLVTAPAFQALWSQHDEFLNHRRRYRLDALESVISKSGLQLVRGCYFYSLLLPVAAATRWAGRLRKFDSGTTQSQLRQHHPLVNKLLAKICRSELGWYQKNRWAGLTAVCLARNSRT